jgi:hypothetical protein
MNACTVVVCAALALAGCSSAPAIPSATKLPVQPVCPPLRAWSGADLKALAEALAPIQADAIIMRMALDWRRYYGDARSCGSAQSH